MIQGDVVKNRLFGPAVACCGFVALVGHASAQAQSEAPVPAGTDGAADALEREDSSDGPTSLQTDGEAAALGTGEAAGEQPTAAVEPAAVAGPARDLEIAPLDFCALAPKQGTGRYQTQRVVLLDVAEDASMAGGPEQESVKRGDKTVQVPRNVLRQSKPYELAREVLLTVFPMRRHYLVHAAAQPPPTMEQQEPLALDAARELLAQDRLALHSVECTDWLVAPYMKRGTAQWTKVKRTKTVTDGKKSRTVEYTAWNLHIPMQLSMQVYRRQGDAFVHHATLTGANSAASRDSHEFDWKDVGFLHTRVSTGLPGDCALPEQPGAVADLSACGGVTLDFSADGLRAPGSGQAAGPYCAGVNDAVTAGAHHMEKLAQCTLRTAMESATFDLQLDGKKMCGWTLFAGLVDVGGQADGGIAMGESEGAERGDYYVAHAPATSCEEAGDSDDELGFARIVRVGPGGEAGVEAPSLVAFRAGHAAAGSRMTEYPLHGFRIGLEPVASYLVAGGDLQSTLFVGGAARVGYDLSWLLPFFDEIWSQAGLGLVFGTDDERIGHVDVGLEGTNYAADRLAIVYGAGFGASTATKTPGGGGNRKLSGSALAVSGRVGFEYALRPEWNARLMAELRACPGGVTLKDDADASQTLDGGALVEASVALSLAYTL